VGGEKNEFRKMLLFLWVKHAQYLSARFYPEDKSKLSGDVSFIKKNNYPKKILM
jgi:hypothetical protein